MGRDVSLTVPLLVTFTFSDTQQQNHQNHYQLHHQPVHPGVPPSNGIVQYTTNSDESTPFFVPSMTSLGGSVGLPGSPPDESSRKREIRLLKNREAARECRRKKKEYIKCLENRVAVLENQNKALIEELKSLKELYTGGGYEASPVPKIEIL